MIDYAAHLLTLAKKHGVDVAVNQVNLHDSHAHPLDNAICIAPVKCEASYAVNMHELGHCVDPDGRLEQRTYEATIRSEEAAWRWAQANTPDWTPTMEHIRQVCLGTYTRERWEKRRRQIDIVERFLKEMEAA